MPFAPRRWYTYTTTSDSQTPGVLNKTLWTSGPLGLTLVKSGPIKDYRLKISLGEYAGSALQVSEASYDSSYFHGVLQYVSRSPLDPEYNAANNGRTRRMDGMSTFLPGLSDPGIPSASKADTAALTKVSKKLSSQLTSFQGGVFVGEIKETVHLIRHPLSALRSGLTEHLKLVAKRAKRIRTAKNMAKMISGTWLETAYGLRPLLGDLDDATNTLAEFLVDPHSREFKTLSAKGVDEKAVDEKLTNVGLSYAGTVHARCMRKRTYTVKYLVCIGVRHSVRETAFERLGVNFANFVPTVWELIPYSFVVDYFSNVGNVLTGLANLNANVRWAMRWDVDEDVEESRNIYTLPSPDPHNFSQNGSGGHLRYTKRTVNRGLYTGSLIPDFRFEIPGLGSLKWYNLAALTTQLALTRRIVKTPERTRLTLLRKGTF